MNPLNIDVRRLVDVRIGPARAATDDGTIQSIARGIEVLRAFGRDNVRMTIADAARATGLTRAGARRILLTLEHLGYVRCDGRHYFITARVLDLGRGFLAQPLWRVVRPALLGVSQAVDETVSAGVLDGQDVVYTLRVRSSRMLQLELRAGARLPAFASSMGCVLLAALSPAALSRYFATTKLAPFTEFTVVDSDVLRKRLDVVRAQDWCHTRDEVELGVSCVAVPVTDPSGRTVAALNVSTRSDRTSAQAVRHRIVPLLREAAASIRRELEAI